MTQVIIGNRGSGKTTELIKISASSGSQIVTTTESKLEMYEETAKKLGLNIPTPITIGEALLDRGYCNFSKDKELLIDDVEEVLYEIFKHPINAISLSTEIKDMIPITNKRIDAVLKKAIREKEEKEKQEEIEQINKRWKEADKLAKSLGVSTPKAYSIPGAGDLDAWEKLGYPMNL